jgi:hypothetical protein
MTSDQAPENKWKIEGRTIYLLQETGRYRKSYPIMENALTVNVQHGRGVSELSAETVAKRIADFLNSTPGPKVER